MSRIILGRLVARICPPVLVLGAAVFLASCASNLGLDIAPHLRPLQRDTIMLLGKKGMDAQTPIFIRIFKEESELEVWKQRDDGRFYHFKTYPICNWSGDLGPKVRTGDRQAPEGFYTVTREQMNPDSKFHLAMNLGYPNAFDRSHRRTGDFLMIHGKCKSAGCYAMTDGLMEEIYAIARESFLGGHDSFQVHAFPFRMTNENMTRFASHEAYPFWQTIKEAYDHFEMTRQLPGITVCDRRYHINVALRNGELPRLDPERACPALVRLRPDPFRPRPGEEFAEQRIVVPGQKMRGLASAEDAAPNASPAPAKAPSSGFAPNMSFAPTR